MENNPELSGREVLEQLAEACARQIEALRETRKMHEDLFGPLDTEQGKESDSLLRLRKVYCHVIAITAWSLDRWVIHVMAPDIRAALEQLRPLVREIVDPGDEYRTSRHFDELDAQLAPFSHPTTVNLACLPEAKGAFGGGGVRLLYSLCLSLHCLLTNYATTLSMEAIRLGLSTELGGMTITVRADPRVELDLAANYMATNYIDSRVET